MDGMGDQRELEEGERTHRGTLALARREQTCARHTSSFRTLQEGARGSGTVCISNGLRWPAWCGSGIADDTVLSLCSGDPPTRC